MAAVLGMFLKNTGHNVVCESGGIGESARGGFASPFGIAAARRIGLDISRHQRRHVDSVSLMEYDLIVCADDDIAGRIVEKGVDVKKVYNAQVINPWPVHFEQDYETTMVAILGSMYKIIARYFPQEFSEV